MVGQGTRNRAVGQEDTTQLSSTDLSPEDSLRLNVLMAGKVEAVRIDTSAMVLYALTDRGEAKVTLHPNSRNDQYLLRVQEFLAGHALGSPGGYPVYLRRWTRMGLTNDKNLAALLLLGEPEAVVAVAHAPALTNELARRVWWLQPTMEIARWMLEKDTVIQGDMGRVLADFLIEHLPFEESANTGMHTLRLILNAGLADDALQRRLWNKARQQPHYFIGFLECLPDALPDDVAARAEYAALSASLQTLIAAGNPYAAQLCRCFSAQGQTFLKAATEVLRRPSTPLIVYALLDVVGVYFRRAGALLADAATLEQILHLTDTLIANNAELKAVLAATPQFSREIRAMLVLAGLRQSVAEPILTRTTAVGALMRTKIDPIAAPILAEMAILQGKPTK